MKISELKGKINTISDGPRLGHFMIDIFMVQVIYYLIAMIPIFEVSGFLSLFIFPVYYIFFEYFYQATPGKYITGTIVIDEYGNKPDIQTIILRTFIRYVPFEPFSCLGNGWHDKWSGTYVIKKEELPGIRERLGLVSTGDMPESLPASGKMKKNLLIILVLSVSGFSVYYTVQQVRKMMNFDFDGVIADLNATDYKMIRGEWDSDWKIYPMLDFKNDSVVMAKNQSGDTLELRYLINAKTLTLKDSTGLKLDYVMLQLTENKMILRDIVTMKENIEFQKK